MRIYVTATLREALIEADETVSRFNGHPALRDADHFGTVIESLTRLVKAVSTAQIEALDLDPSDTAIMASFDSDALYDSADSASDAMNYLMGEARVVAGNSLSRSYGENTGRALGMLRGLVGDIKRGLINQAVDNVRNLYDGDVLPLIVTAAIASSKANEKGDA